VYLAHLTATIEASDDEASVDRLTNGMLGGALVEQDIEDALVAAGYGDYIGMIQPMLGQPDIDTDGDRVADAISFALGFEAVHCTLQE
jgi:hypothetical protein